MPIDQVTLNFNPESLLLLNIILGFVMYLSKRINWYGQINEENQLKES